jgi:hypothetical protein
MIRLIRSSILLTLLVALLMAGARTIGAHRPPSTAQLFTLPDGGPCIHPCLLGVQPGMTTYREAGQIIRRHPLIASQYVWERAGANTLDIMGRYLTVSLIADEYGAVAAVSLHLQPDLAGYMDVLPRTELKRGMVWLGDMMRLIGPPGLVQVAYSKMGMTRMFYPQQGFVVTSFAAGNPNQKRVDLHDKLMYVGLAAATWYREAWNGPMLTASAWQGFSKAKRYFGRWQ